MPPVVTCVSSNADTIAADTVEYNTIRQHDGLVTLLAFTEKGWKRGCKYTFVQSNPTTGMTDSFWLTLTLHLCVYARRHGTSTDSLVVVPYALRRMFLRQDVQPWQLCRQLRAGQSNAFTSVQMTARSGHHSAEGRRDTMEDAVLQHGSIAVPEVDITGAVAYCVFDGHGGPDCAKYAAKHFLATLLEQLRAGHNWREALCTCYTEIDAALRRAEAIDGATAISVVFDGINK
jgi:Protein phosphatase 2C